MQHGNLFTILFAGAICAVFSLLVCLSAVLLGDRQEENKLLDRRSKVLTVAGLMEPGERLSRDEINRRFEDNIQARVIERETGAYLDDIDANAFDQRQAALDPETSQRAPDNDAKVRRLPDQAVVYQVTVDGRVSQHILPVEGMGLWSTLYGYLALEEDLNTVQGITFYEHAETPGLGGEVDNPRWKARWNGRKLFDDEGQTRIEVIKGYAKDPAEDPHRVDGLSGATLTARGVQHLVRFWLGEDGFGPYLEQRHAEGATP